MKRIFAIFLAGCMLLALHACAKRAAAPDGAAEDGAVEAAGTAGKPAVAAGPLSPVDGKTVAFISRSADDPFYAAAKEGARSYAAQWGMELRCPDELGQLAAIQQAIDEGVDAICISAGDADGLEDKLKEAMDAGICVSTWDTDVSPDARALMVAQGSASTLGAMLVEMGVASLRERGVDVNEEVLYVWRSTLAEDESLPAWYAAAKDHIRANYPAWVEVDAPYCSGQEDSVAVAEALLEDYPTVGLILCGDSAALTGQCQAAQNKGLTAENLTITGFCPPSAMQMYLDAGVCTRWGLWDCGMQAAMSCYLAAFLAAGNDVRVGDVVDIPRIGSVEILANSALAEGQETAEKNNGVVLLPERVVFTAENAANYNF